jgi:hypothetical protein
MPNVSDVPTVVAPRRAEARRGRGAALGRLLTPLVRRLRVRVRVRELVLLRVRVRVRVWL